MANCHLRQFLIRRHAPPIQQDEYEQEGDASGLHVIIFDEIDAICKQRGSSTGGVGVGDSVVNQLLSKIDGVDALNNILVRSHTYACTHESLEVPRQPPSRVSHRLSA